MELLSTSETQVHTHFTPFTTSSLLKPRYCNSIPFVAPPRCIQNSAHSTGDHMTPVLQNLPWLHRLLIIICLTSCADTLTPATITVYRHRPIECIMIHITLLCACAALLGIHDLSTPDYGEPVQLLPGDVPVFWACGVTAIEAILCSSKRYAGLNLLIVVSCLMTWCSAPLQSLIWHSVTPQAVCS